MEVKPKTRVSIIPAGSSAGSSTPTTTTTTTTSEGGGPVRITIGGGGGGSSNPNPNPIRIGGGGGGHSAPGGFVPRAPRYPRRDLSKFNTDEHRINERIRVPQVRLIDHEGNQVGVVDTPQAMQMARDVGLDLVEISPNAAPPVCKILDYGKFKYEKKKKDHEAKKKQVVVKVKEIQLRPNTDEHDIAYKFKNVRTFLEEGDKAKITMMFRGREVAYVENGRKLLARLIEELGDLAVVEANAKLEGKKLIMVLGPNPKYKPKKEPKPASEKVEKAEKPPKAEEKEEAAGE
jgi:translation initiation factor IF-3